MIEAAQAKLQTGLDGRCSVIIDLILPSENKGWRKMVLVEEEMGVAPVGGGAGGAGGAGDFIIICAAQPEGFS